MARSDTPGHLAVDYVLAYPDYSLDYPDYSLDYPDLHLPAITRDGDAF